MKYVISLGFLCIGLFVGSSKAQDVESVVDQARLMRLQGDAKASAGTLATVTAQHPDNFRAQYNLALAYLETGDQPKADQAFKAAVQLKNEQKAPDNSIYNSYGWFLLQQGNLEGATEQLNEGLKHADELPEKSKQRLYNNVGVLKLQTGRFEDAKKYFSLAADAGSPTAVNNLKIVDEARKIRASEMVTK